MVPGVAGGQSPSTCSLTGPILPPNWDRPRPETGSENRLHNGLHALDALVMLGGRRLHAGEVPTWVPDQDVRDDCLGRHRVATKGQGPAAVQLLVA